MFVPRLWSLSVRTDVYILMINSQQGQFLLSHYSGKTQKKLLADTISFLELCICQDFKVLQKMKIRNIYQLYRDIIYT